MCYPYLDSDFKLLNDLMGSLYRVEINPRFGPALVFDPSRQLRRELAQERLDVYVGADALTDVLQTEKPRHRTSSNNNRASYAVDNTCQVASVLQCGGARRCDLSQVPNALIFTAPESG